MRRQMFAPSDEPIAFGFDFPHLLSDHLEPLPFALDIDLQPCPNRPTIAGPHLIKTLTPLCICDPERPNAMRYRKGLDSTPRPIMKHISRFHR
jgi:hypothetical protein